MTRSSKVLVVSFSNWNNCLLLPTPFLISHWLSCRWTAVECSPNSTTLCSTETYTGCVTLLLLLTKYEYMLFLYALSRGSGNHPSAAWLHYA